MKHTTLSPVTILEGDCRTILPQMPAESVDLVVADPPYGKDYQSHRTKTRRPKIESDGVLEKAVALLNDVAPELYRVLKADAHCYVFSAGEYDLYFMTPFTAAGFTVSERLVWLRGRTMGDTTGQSYVSAYETVWWFTKGNRKLNGHPANVIKIPKSSRELHPTQKNIYGLSELIINSSQAGEVVLDPFAGSGSVGAACRLCPDEARKVILIEKDPGNVAIIRERMKIYG